jgi:hypothetical protein
MSGNRKRVTLACFVAGALLAVAVCIAQAAVLVRRFPAVHPVTMNAVGMTTGAALLLAGPLVLAGVYVGALRPARLPPMPGAVAPPR